MDLLGGVKPKAVEGDRDPVARALIRLAVVDDHQMFVEAIKLLLAGELDIETVGAASTANEAIEMCRRTHPDVVLMDIDMTGLSGLEGTRRIREQCPDTQVVILSALNQPAVIARALDAGACAYVQKTRAADYLMDVIRNAAAGELVFPPAEGKALNPSHGPWPDLLGDGIPMSLTSREAEILQALATGKSTRAVAEALFISPLTVQTHVKSILAKLGVRSKLEAVVLGARLGLVFIP